MTSINAATASIPSSSADIFYTSTNASCRTTFANFGPLTSYTVPPSCQHTPAFSDVRNGDVSLFRCPDSLAYKSCMPSPSLASLFSIQHDQQCDQIYTYHSPELACPTGWSLGAQFTLAMSEKKNGQTVSQRSSGAEQVAPDGRYPALAGTHRLCCPTSYQLTGGPSYGCQSIGYASAVGNTSFCGLACDPNGIAPGCATTTTGIHVTAATPIVILTYGMDPVYVIGGEPPQPLHDGISSKDITYAAVFSILGALILVTLALMLVFMRRRHLRRVNEKRSEDLELPQYSRCDPLSGQAQLDVERDKSCGPPPAYDSPQVWEGNDQHTRVGVAN